MDPDNVGALMFLVGFISFIVLLVISIQWISAMFVIKKTLIEMSAVQKEACEYQKQTRDILYEMANRGRKQQ